MIRKQEKRENNLKKKIKICDNRVEELEYDINETIDELKVMVSTLQETLNYLKDMGMIY